MRKQPLPINVSVNNFQTKKITQTNVASGLSEFRYWLSDATVELLKNRYWALGRL